MARSCRPHIAWIGLGLGSAAALSVGSARAQSIPLSPTALASGAVVTVDQGIDFVTIGATGNQPWNGVPGPVGAALGRGGVDYEYRIGRFEVTTSQWVEFFNAALDRPATDRLPHVVAPGAWGAQGTTAQNPGGQRFTVPTGNAMRPVGNINWRMAAMYCNWLHNDKRTDRDAFTNGAYDVGTFGYIGNIFTDQLTHNPEARYWIPTWDEWLKAAHYDPNKSGPGQGGYWAYSTTSDLIPIYGPPEFGGGGITQVNGAWTSANFPGFNPFTISLGAYPSVQSPWGLLDVAGATTEWTEDVLTGGAEVRWRRIDGSSWGGATGSRVRDHISTEIEEFPSISTFDYGFRIASAVPTSGTAPVLVALAVSALRRRKR